MAMGLKLLKQLTVAVLLVLLLTCAAAVLLALAPHDAPAVTDSGTFLSCELTLFLVMHGRSFVCGACGYDYRSARDVEFYSRHG